jgi:hypothetical protein
VKKKFPRCYKKKMKSSLKFPVCGENYLGSADTKRDFLEKNVLLEQIECRDRRFSVVIFLRGKIQSLEVIELCFSIDKIAMIRANFLM